MNVVCRTVDDQGRTISLPDNATHVREKTAGEFGGQIRETVLCGEDDIEEQGSEAVRHRLTPRSGANPTLRPIPPGSRRGLCSFALRARRRKQRTSIVEHHEQNSQLMPPRAPESAWAAESALRRRAAVRIGRAHV